MKTPTVETKILNMIVEQEATEADLIEDLTKQTPGDSLIITTFKKGIKEPTIYAIWKDEAEYHVTLGNTEHDWEWWGRVIGWDTPVVWHGIHTTLGEIDWDRYF